MDDFIFSENDTIGTIIHSEYRQDQKIRYTGIRQPEPTNKSKKPPRKSSVSMNEAPLAGGSKNMPFFKDADRTRAGGQEHHQ